MAEAVVTPVVEKGIDALIAFISKQLGYLFSYNRNVKRMKGLIEDLKDKKHDVDESVNRATWNNENIRPAVRTWLDRVEGNKLYLENVTKDEAEYGQGCCTKNSINLISRYRLSRNAVKSAEELVDLLASGAFDTVSEPPRPPGIIPESADRSTANDQVAHGNSEEESSSYESRLSILSAVVEAIEDDTSRIIGIYGLGGMGKSTLVMDVVRKVKDKTLVVDEYAMSVDNNEVVEARIQGDIAEYLGLGLKFKEQKNLFIRANELRQRLTQKRNGSEDRYKKILIILDNLGSTVDLNKVGIPSENNLHDCKLVLVSRDKSVCDQMNASKTFHVRPLGDKEAWSLFQKVAKTDLHPGDSRYTIGKDILIQCEGSPLAIKTNAIGLINKDKDEWIDWHKQLVRSEFDGEYAAANKALKVRYDKLESKEIQNFFLLCCIFPKGFSILIEDLVRYGSGFRLFDTVKKMEGARSKAFKHVEKLRSLNLLEASQSRVFVTMHELVRDFGLWISDRGENVFTVKFGKGVYTWPKDGTYEHCTAISLQCDEMDLFPDNPNCPNLDLLQLIHRKEFRKSKLPDAFFKDMKKLQVLALRNMPIPKFNFLVNIRTLSLDNCKFVYTLSSMLGYLEKLEILSCVNSNIKELPLEAKNLSRLRLLDLTGCKEFHRITPGVLPFLVSLEELYMRGTSVRWAEQIHANNDDGEANASFHELESVSSLVAIEIEIPYEVFPIGPVEEPGFFCKEGDDE